MSNVCYIVFWKHENNIRLNVLISSSLFIYMFGNFKSFNNKNKKYPLKMFIINFYKVISKIYNYLKTNSHATEVGI